MGVFECYGRQMDLRVWGDIYLVRVVVAALVVFFGLNFVLGLLFLVGQFIWLGFGCLLREIDDFGGC